MMCLCYLLLHSQPLAAPTQVPSSMSLLAEGTHMPQSWPMGRSPQAPAHVSGKAGTGEPPPALAAPTKRGGEESVHDDVCVAADG